MNQILDFLKSVPVTLTISVFSVLVYVLTGLQSPFEFSFATFQWWELHRLLGCHLLHWSTEHLFWDVVMFAVLGGICERTDRRSFLLTLLVSAVAIPLVARAVSPEAISYRGLSGIDTALFSLLALRILVDHIRRKDWVTALIVSGFAIGLIVKICFEFSSRSAVFVDASNFTPLPSAHVVGAVLGLVIASLRMTGPRRTRRKKEKYLTMTERLSVKQN